MIMIIMILFDGKAIEANLRVLSLRFAMFYNL